MLLVWWSRVVLRCCVVLCGIAWCCVVLCGVAVCCWLPKITQESDRRLVCDVSQASMRLAGVAVHDLLSTGIIRSRLTPFVPAHRAGSASESGPLCRILRDLDLQASEHLGRLRHGSQIGIQTQYLVVNPPPRYEIVGLLQQRSYTPVNEFFPIRMSRGPRIPC